MQFCNLLKGTSWNRVRLISKENEQARKICLNADKFFFMKNTASIYFQCFSKTWKQFQAQNTIILTGFKSLEILQRNHGSFCFHFLSNTVEEIPSKINPSSLKDQFVYTCVCVCIAEKERASESNAHYSAHEQFPLT